MGSIIIAQTTMNTIPTNLKKKNTQGYSSTPFNKVNSMLLEMIPASIISLN